MRIIFHPFVIQCINLIFKNKDANSLYPSLMRDLASLRTECGHEVTYSLRIRVHPSEDFCLLGKYTTFDCTFLINKNKI